MYTLFRDLFTYFQLLKGMYVITCKRRSIYTAKSVALVS